MNILKTVLYIALFLGFSLVGICQQVKNLTFECLEDRETGGKVFQPLVFKDSVQMSLKTYGPCNAEPEVKVSEVGEGKVIRFDISDKNKVYSGGKLKCGCFYRLQFKILDFNLKPNFQGWTINNHTVPKDVWDKWYWDNIE